MAPSGGGGVKAASAYFLPSLFPPPIVQVRERLIAMRKQSSLDDVSVVRREGEGRAAKDRVLFRTRAPALTIRAGSTPTPEEPRFRLLGLSGIGTGIIVEKESLSNKQFLIS